MGWTGKTLKLPVNGNKVYDVAARGIRELCGGYYGKEGVYVKIDCRRREQGGKFNQACLVFCACHLRLHWPRQFVLWALSVLKGSEW